MKKTISKKLFLSTLEVIQKQMEKDHENAEKLSEVYDSFVEPYNNLLLGQIIKILNKGFGLKKTEYGTDIEYFIYDLEFGKKYREGCFKVDDEPVSMATAEDLWIYINTNYEK